MLVVVVIAIQDLCEPHLTGVLFIICFLLLACLLSYFLTGCMCVYCCRACYTGSLVWCGSSSARTL